MKRSKHSMAIVVLVLGLLISPGLGLAATAAPMAIVTVCSGQDGCITTTLLIDGKSFGSSLLPNNRPIHFGSEADGLTVNQLLLTGDIDPFQTLAIGIVDAGAASPFSAMVMSPFIPTLTGPFDYLAFLSGSCAAGSPAGCAVTPLIGDIAQYNINMLPVTSRGDSQSLPFPGGNWSGPKYTAITGSSDCSAFGGTCLTLETTINFMGSGNFDAEAFTSTWEIRPTNTVPEASTFGYMAIGLGLLGITGYRQHKKAYRLSSI